MADGTTYECGICGFEYDKIADMGRHLIVEHTATIVDADLVIFHDPEPISKTTPGAYVCNLCDKPYRGLTQMTAHLLDTHPGCLWRRNETLPGGAQ